MNETKKKPTTAPVKTIRHGAIAASIWKRQATSGFEYFDFTVSRSWKTSATGKEGYSSSFFARYVDDLHAVILEAANWMESQQASLQENNDFKNQAILQKAAQTNWAAMGRRPSTSPEIFIREPATSIAVLQSTSGLAIPVESPRLKAQEALVQDRRIHQNADPFLDRELRRQP